MKKGLLLTILILLTMSVHAAFVRQAPVVRQQPNGDTLHCFVTGDEYYQRLHDADGYTIVQDRNGWYVYAVRQWNTDRSDWTLAASTLVAGRDNAAAAGLEPRVAESPATLAQLRHRYDIPEKYRPAGTDAHGNRLNRGSKDGSDMNHGTLNNVVIFIRFADDGNIATSYNTIEGMFNDSSANSVSMYNYFKHASYDQLHVPTYFYPSPQGNTVISYQDTLPRSYYMPWSYSNPDGYANDNERADREFGLLERAVNWVNANTPVPTSLNIDSDNDGMVDNICFIVKGTYTGWSELLWPHKWALYDRYVYLNGKRVYTFNLQLEGSGTHYFSTSTFCHEMFHTLGAPDLYHYNAYTDANSIGPWDLMCNNSTPPQHMSIYMKMRYGGWVDSVPVLREAGTYSLLPVSDSRGQHNAYRIQGQDPWVWYYLEYRNNTQPFEYALPGSGLLVYRIDTRFMGNADFDFVNQFDEVYLFHPDGVVDTTSGNVGGAFLSATANRPDFTTTTNPHPFLAGGTIDTTLSITNISAPGDSITFTYTPHRAPMANLGCGDDTCTLTITMTSPYGLHWLGGYMEVQTLSGDPIALLSKGDCRVAETVTIPVCNAPVRAIIHPSYYSDAVQYSIRRSDGTEWQPSGNNAVLATPCHESVPQQCTITVASNDDNCHVSGSGTYNAGTVTRIHAYPNNHYLFVGWHDGPYNGTANIVSTEPHRDVTLMSDTLCTAIFTRESKTLTVLSNNTALGTVSGGGEYLYGDTAILLAIPSVGCHFVEWRMGATQFTDNPLYIIVKYNDTYTAYFEQGASIDKADNQLSCHVSDGVLHIEGAGGQPLMVADINGRLIWSIRQAQASEAIVLPAHGIFLVRCNETVRKVVY